MEMRFQFLLAVLLAVLAPSLVTAPANAQSTAADVTFAVPLNLTNLATDITKVRVQCSLPFATQQSANAGFRQGEVEIPVTNRQVVTTAQVTVMIPVAAVSQTAAGQSMSYNCELALYSASLGWSAGAFGPDERSGSFRTTQAVSSRIVGQFQW
jgi:hypothetical protein